MTTFADWVEVYANSKRGKNTIPVKVDRPWLKGARVTAPKPPTTESQARRQVLAERLGLIN